MLDKLPPEILYKICLFLNPKDLISLEKLNHQLKNISTSDLVWKQVDGHSKGEYKNQHIFFKASLLPSNKLDIGLIADKESSVLRLMASVPKMYDDYNRVRVNSSKFTLWHSEHPNYDMQARYQKNLLLIDVRDMNDLNHILKKQETSSIIFVINPPEKNFNFEKHVFEINTIKDETPEKFFERVYSILNNYFPGIRPTQESQQERQPSRCVII